MGAMTPAGSNDLKRGVANCLLKKRRMDISPICIGATIGTGRQSAMPAGWKCRRIVPRGAGG